MSYETPDDTPDTDNDADELTLEQFTQEVTATLQDFIALWKRGQSDPQAREAWPNRMPSGDWWEQFTQHDPIPGPGPTT